VQAFDLAIGLRTCGSGSENPKNTSVYSDGEIKPLSGVTLGGAAGGESDGARAPAAGQAVRKEIVIKGATLELRVGSFQGERRSQQPSCVKSGLTLVALTV